MTDPVPRRRRARALLGVTAAAMAVAAACAAGATASAEQHAPDNRAVVVVALPGGGTKSACVLFREPSITGLDLLRAARMEPETYGMGQGAAVCKLCGEGCPRTRGECLSCDGGKYWQYYRAESGGGYRYSSSGAGSAQVTDGDVDGWSFGKEQRQPVLVAVDTVCSDPQRTFRYESGSSSSTTEAPQPTSPATSTTAAPSTTAPSAAARPSPATSLATPHGGPAAPATSVASGSVAAAPDAPAPSSTSTAPVDPSGRAEDGAGAQADGVAAGGDDERDRRMELAGGAGDEAGEPGSSRVAWLLFAALLAGLLGATFRARRVRRRSLA